MTLCLVISGCAVRPPMQLAQPVAIAPSQSLWQLELTTPQGQDSMLLDVQAEAGSLQLVGLTPLGQKTMHLKAVPSSEGQTPTKTTVQTIVPPPRRIPAEVLVSAVQLALWPEAELRKSLQADERLEVADGVRTVSRSGEVVAASRATMARQPAPGTRISVTVTRPALQLEMVMLESP